MLCSVQKLTLKILEIVSLTKNKMEVSHDEMQFDAPVSNKTYLNVRNMAVLSF
jgi:hypothetical protein